MQRVIALVFAGGREPELSVLTERRAKAAVLFGGVYRGIDFALSNLAESGVGRVGILTQYRPSSLMDHVDTGHAWDLIGSQRSLRFLPPSLGPISGSSGKGDWYRGPADALYQNLDFILRHDAEHVLLVSGDHPYKMDYHKLLDFHMEHDADLSMAFKSVEDASRFGVAELNSAQQIMSFSEKPKYPRSNLASVGVYMFKRSVLVDELHRAMAGDNETTFEIHEVLRRMISRRRAYGWTFDGPWYYTRSVDAYVEFHRAMLGQDPAVVLANWGLRTNLLGRRSAVPAPARIFPGAVVEDSLVSPGAVVMGTLRRSVVSPGVVVEAGALVEDCILWDDVTVMAGARLSGVVADKRARFMPGAQLGLGDETPANSLWPQSLTCGASLVGMDAQIPAKARVGRNCIIAPEVAEDEFAPYLDAGLSSGDNIKGKEARP